MRSSIVAAFVAACAFAVPAEAAVIFDFENEPVVETTPFSMVSSGLTATFAGSLLGDPGAFEISFNSSSGPFPAPYNGLSGAFLTTAPTSIDPASPLTITFSAPVTQISLNFGLGDSSGALRLATDAGGSAQANGAVATGFLFAEGTLSFTGAAFRSVTLSTAADGLALDNISVDPTVAAVPEPMTAVMLGSGLLGLAGLRRRTRK